MPCHFSWKLLRVGFFAVSHCLGEHLFNDCAGGHQGGHCVIHDTYCIPREMPPGKEEDSSVLLTPKTFVYRAMGHGT